MESVPSPTPHFRIGDRVKLISPLTGVAVHAIGTVVSQFLGGSHYDVQFDRYSGARVIDGSKLGLAPPEPSRRR